ncbi:MAG: hypothetical protein DWQ02_08550 [Bacteroidetes bacterium]|nr:MAG: hypothetical protein DWQ02_08550 [Bacteroidota bacterium]
MIFQLKKTAFLFICLVIIFLACNSSDNNTTKEQEQTGIQPKLFLLSKGLETDTLKQAFLEFLDTEVNKQKVAVIVNASSSDKKKVKKVKKVKRRFQEIGFDSTQIELFDVMKRNPRELVDFDIIYTLGGNPFLLLDEVKKSGAGAVLSEIAYEYKDKVLMGYSAGTLLLGPNMELMNAVDSLLGFNEMQLTELTCLELYDFLIFPHYDEFTAEVEGLAEAIRQFEEQSTFEIIRLNDNEGIMIKDGQMKFVGR